MAICSFARTLVCILLTSLLFLLGVGAQLDRITSIPKKNEDSRRLQGYGGEAVFSPPTNEALTEAVGIWINDNGLAVDTYGPIQDWDTSIITDMSALFYRATELNGFNGDISEWDVSSVIKMNSMFFGATAFNGDISKWNVSSVTSTGSMLRGATMFNGDMSEWDVSSVTYMGGMFSGATAFDGDISKWNVSSVTSMQAMFDGATAFNSAISDWDVSSVDIMYRMFYGATAFAQTLCWDLNLTYADNMFDGSSGNLDPTAGDLDPKCGTTSGDSVGMSMALPKTLIIVSFVLSILAISLIQGRKMGKNSIHG